MNDFSIRVILADDHPALLLGVQHELSTIRSIKLVGSANNSTELVALLQSTECDVVVTDYAMPAGAHGDGIALLTLLQRRYPRVKLVVFTMLDNLAVVSALIRIGITAIVSKSDPVTHLIPSIHAAYSGGTYYSPSIDSAVKFAGEGSDHNEPGAILSAREVEVVRLFVSGMTVGDIGRQMNRSSKTISAQKANAMRKLNLKHDAELVRYALDSGLVTRVPGGSDAGSPDSGRSGHS